MTRKNGTVSDVFLFTALQYIFAFTHNRN